MTKKHCPNLYNCECVLEKKDFEKQCLRNWKDCFVNNAKLPREWILIKLCEKLEEKQKP